MPKRVLVVDDDPAQRRILEETIKRFGYAVAAAESGDKALAALKADAAGDICLILLDLVMPGTDGMAVLAAMRSLPQEASGHRADCQWQHRRGNRRHASGRRRLRGQAGEPRAARSFHQERAQDRGAGGRADPHQGLRQGRARFCRSDRRQRGDGPGHRARPTRRQFVHTRADRGRERRRQGVDRARHPGRKRPRRQAFRHGQLRRHSRESGREHPVRPREGLVHRRLREAGRQIPGGRSAARCSSTRSASCRSMRK